MYAIIDTSGKQYKVSPKDVINVNRVEGKEGDTVVFNKVLLMQDKDIKLGAPYLDKAEVKGKIVSQFRGKKVLVGKHKRRKDYQKITGYRSDLTAVEIQSIKA